MGLIGAMRRAETRCTPCTLTRGRRGDYKQQGGKQHRVSSSDSELNRMKRSAPACCRLARSMHTGWNF